MRTEKVSIRFFDGQGEYAGKYWHHVPRVGDEVMLKGGKRYKADKDGKAPFRVVRVIWGVEGPDYSHCQCVNIEIEPLGELLEVSP